MEKSQNWLVASTFMMPGRQPKTKPTGLSTVVNGRGKQHKYPSRSIREQEDMDQALEAYLLDHVPALREFYAAQHRAFLRIGENALARHPDPTPDDIASAEAAEAALPSRKRTEAQVRRGFVTLAAYLPVEIKRTRKRFLQRAQRAWNRDNPSPLTPKLQRLHTAEFMKTYTEPDRP